MSGCDTGRGGVGESQRTLREVYDADMAWAAVAAMKARMNAAGWWLSLRDAGDGKQVDVCWFWSRDWRREGRVRGPRGEEPRLVKEAAEKALSSAVPE